MVQRLALLAKNSTPEHDPYNSPKVVAGLRDGIVLAQHPGKKAFMRYQLAEALLRGGDHAGCLSEIRAMRELKLVEKGLAPPQLERALLDLETTAHLLQARLDTCLVLNGAKPCSVPGGGIQSQRDGPTAASNVLDVLLLQGPNLNLRWLRNVAAMVLGDHPVGVPEEWRIDPAVFASEFDIGRFENIAADVGAASVGRSGGSVMEDLNGDGLLDLMSSSSGLSDALVLLHNDGEGGFLDKSAALAGLLGGINLSTADVDNDGDIDVFVARGAWHPDGAPNSLLVNQGDGTFEDGTEAAGLLTTHPNHAAVWADFDGDGHIDLFVGSEASPARPHPSELFKNNGDGTFSDVSALLRDPVLGLVKGAAWGDIDNDDRPDLFVARMGEQNLLFHNDGPQPDGTWGFTEVAAGAGVGEPEQALASWFWDVDHDGFQDLFVAGFEQGADAKATAALYLDLPHEGSVSKLFRNRGDGTFEDVTAEVGLDRVPLVMGANFGDLDNDGWLDLFLGTGNAALSSLVPNRVFRNDGGKRFQDVTSSGGFGHLQKGNGVSFGDLDGDGDQDVHVDLGGAYTADLGRNALFRNPGHGHHWITLKLQGVASNRAAIGARIRVRTVTPKGERDFHHTVGSGGSFGANSMQQEIGLGRSNSVQSIEVRWPSTGETQTLSGVKMDQAYVLVEGKELEPVELPQVAPER